MTLSMKANDLAASVYGRKRWWSTVELGLHTLQTQRVLTHFFSPGEELLAAAYLHEVFSAEKPLTLADVSAATNEYVASLVWAVEPGIPWAETLKRCKGVRGAAQLKYAERVTRVAYGSSPQYMEAFIPFTEAMGRQIRRDLGDNGTVNEIRRAYETLVYSHDSPGRMWGWWNSTIQNYRSGESSKKNFSVSINDQYVPVPEYEDWMDDTITNRLTEESVVRQLIVNSRGYGSNTSPLLTSTATATGF